MDGDNKVSIRRMVQNILIVAFYYVLGDTNFLRLIFSSGIKIIVLAIVFTLMILNKSINQITKDNDNKLDTNL